MKFFFFSSLNFKRLEAQIVADLIGQDRRYFPVHGIGLYENLCPMNSVCNRKVVATWTLGLHLKSTKKNIRKK